MSGATQIRAGVIRPEIIVPHGSPPAVNGQSLETDSARANVAMTVGSQVRLIREPRFGALGRVVDLPVEAVAVETEARVRVLEVELESGDRLVLPRANVELIEA